MIFKTKWCKNLCFLIKPWLIYGKNVAVLNAMITVFMVPIGSYYSTVMAQKIIDETIRTNNFNRAFMVGIKCLLISLGVFIVRSAFEDLYRNYKNCEIEAKINWYIYSKALALDYKNLDEPEYYNSYKVVTDGFGKRSSDAISHLYSFVTEIIKGSVYAFLIAIHGIFLLFVVIACSVLMTFAQMYWSKVSVERERKVAEPNQIMDYVRRLFFDKVSIADMHCTKLPRFIQNLYYKASFERTNLYKKYGKKELLIDVCMSIAELGVTFFVPIYLAFQMCYNKQTSVGVYATLIAASIALRDSLNAIGWWWSQLSLDIAYTNNAKRFFDLPSEIENTCSGDEKIEIPYSIKIENISFSYSHTKCGIKNLSMEIKKGEKIAIVGENGAGKTTLTKLLLRLYDVDEGRILINDKDIREYNIKKLRERIGVAFQNSKLYAMSLEDNLALYSEAEIEGYRERLERVGLSLDLKSSMTRELDEVGIELSGGDEQRVCIARILGHKFGLLILDEPSSALDPIAEYNLNKEIFNNSEGITTIMIAHRLSTVVDADRIYLFQNGEIAEKGTHVELMKKNGKYAEMFKKQSEAYLENV